MKHVSLALIYGLVLSITAFAATPAFAQSITPLGGQVGPSYTTAGSAIIGAECDLTTDQNTDPSMVCIDGTYCAHDSGTPANTGTCRAVTSSLGIECMPNTSDCGSGTVCEQNSQGSYVCSVASGSSENGYSGQGGNSGISPVPAAPTPTSPTPAPSSGGINTTYIAGYSNSLKNIINTYLVPVLIAIAFIVFLYGVYKYFIQGAAKPESRKTGASFVLYGIIGLVIIFSVWGLVRILGDTIGVTPGGGPPASGYPTL